MANEDDPQLPAVTQGGAVSTVANEEELPATVSAQLPHAIQGGAVSTVGMLGFGLV